MQITRYDVHHHFLKRLIKFFWVVTGDHEVITPYNLLPVNNIDIVFNFSGSIRYTSAHSKKIRVQGGHLSGIRTQPSLVEHSGRPDLIGISFFPLGLYPFLKIPLSELTDTTIELELLNKEFIERVGEQFEAALSITEKLQILEQEFVRILDMQRFPSQDIVRVAHHVFSFVEPVTIPQLCETYGIHPRTLERKFQTYIGIRPKLFQRLTRFQYALNHIMAETSPRLSTVAHEYEYYDQSHFIKEFTAFSGCSPSQYLRNTTFAKQILPGNDVNS
jgi:AraC-like DNA-binding protein